MYPFALWALPLLAMFVVLLARLAPEHRSRLRFVLWVLIFSAALAIASIFVPGRVWIVETSRTLIELAGVQAGAIFIFHVLLRRFALPRLASDLAIGAGYLAVFVTALSRVGTNVAGLITTSAVLTAVIGFAFQDMLANLVGGLVLEFERSFVEGDWIRTDQGIGLVRSVRLRHTALETPDGDITIIPNSVLTKSPVQVLGRARGRQDALKHRLLIRFCAGYQHSPGLVIDAVENALAASPIDGIAAEPSPRCIVVDFPAGYVQYGVLVWIVRPGMELVDTSMVRRRIYFALARAGVKLESIPYVLDTSSAGQLAHPEDDRLSALNRIDVFRALEPEEAQRLASLMRKTSYAEGEVILRQGEDGDSLYVVQRGSVRVLLSRDSGLAEQVAMLGSGDFFGEMSLLTGSPRSATVTAARQTDCLVIRKQDLLSLLQSRPALASDIAAVIAKRQSELDSIQERLSEQEFRLKQQNRRNDMLSRIQQYFGITVRS